MLQRSIALAPLLRTCRGHGARQARNFFFFPASEMRLIRDMDAEMDRLQRNVFRRFPFGFDSPRFVQIDGVSKPFRMNVDVEDFKPEDIKITMKNNMIRIEAKVDKEDKHGNKFYKSYVREFTVPRDVDQSTIKSYLSSDGVLCIEAEKRYLEEPRTIPINHENDSSANEDSPKSKL